MMGGGGDHKYATLLATPNPAGPTGFGQPIFCPAQNSGLNYTVGVTSWTVLTDATGAAVQPGAIASPFADDLATTDFGSFLASVGNIHYLFNPGTSTYFKSRQLLDTTDDAGMESDGLQGTVARLQGFSGTLWDRWRNNMQTVVLASAARVATLNSADQINFNGRGVHVPINVTVSPGGGQTLTPVIQGFDIASGAYYDILTGTAITATGMTVLKVYPGINGLAGAAAPDIVPRIWRVRVVHSGAGSWTYSVGGNVIV